MTGKFPKYKPVGVARTYDELQPLLREIADASGWSRAEIDRRGGLPDNYSSKALAPVPVGTTDNPGAKLIAKLLRGIGAVLIVAKATEALDRHADSSTKRREDRVHARLLTADVFIAAKALLARQNGKKGGLARTKKVPLWKRRAISRRGARITNRKRRLMAQKEMLKRPDLMKQVVI